MLFYFCLSDSSIFYPGDTRRVQLHDVAACARRGGSELSFSSQIHGEKHTYFTTNLHTFASQTKKMKTSHIPHGSIEGTSGRNKFRRLIPRIEKLSSQHLPSITSPHIVSPALTSPENHVPTDGRSMAKASGCCPHTVLEGHWCEHPTNSR